MAPPAEYLAEAFNIAWPAFVSDVGMVVSARLNQRGGSYAQHLVPIADEVVRKLITKQAVSDASAAFTRRARLHPEAGDYLLREASFYHALAAQSVQDVSTTDVDTVGAGKTIKDSFEKYLAKLPSRWKRLLDVLNEILSIAKGG